MTPRPALRRLAIAALMIAALAPACKRQEAHGVTGPVRAAPAGEPAAVEQAPVPPPGEVASALEAGRRAEAAGDRVQAAEFYEHVTLMPEAAGTQVADAHLALAMMAADPASPQRDYGLAREHLKAMLEAEPQHPRAREASLLLALIEEVGALQVRAQELTTESETNKQTVTDLIARLDAKEKELQKVKQVLLQNKP